MHDREMFMTLRGSMFFFHWSEISPDPHFQWGRTSDDLRPYTLPSALLFSERVHMRDRISAQWEWTIDPRQTIALPVLVYPTVYREQEDSWRIAQPYLRREPTRGIWLRICVLTKPVPRRESTMTGRIRIRSLIEREE